MEETAGNFKEAAAGSGCVSRVSQAATHCPLSDMARRSDPSLEPVCSLSSLYP